MNNRNYLYHFEYISRDTDIESSPDELRILYIVDGECRVVSDGEVSLMRRADILCINPMTEGKLEAKDRLLAAVLMIPYYELCQTMGRMARFYLDSTKSGGALIVETQNIIRGLLMAEVGEPEKNRLQAMGLYYLVLQKLVADFAIEQDTRGAKDEREAKAIELLQNVWLNYRNDISLTSLASEMYLSRSTVSRLFKRYTGQDFPEYLRNLRLRAVRAELLRTDKSITDIALDCGFSSSSVMNRSFREVYQITPGQYREEQAVSAATDEAELREVKDILLQEGNLRISEGERLEIIPIPVHEAVPQNFWKNRVLNVGTMSSLFNARMQEQVLFLQERLEIEYIRLWNPFALSMMVYDEKSREYNFSFMDEIFDFCVDHHFKVYIDLAPRRERNMANERTEIAGSSTRGQFASLRDWLDALHAMILHLRSRYREEVVRYWIFELTFFLNDMPYHGGDYNEAKLWDESYEVIKSIIPEARIAGPGLLTSSDPGKDEEIIRELKRNSRHMPDIFTSMHFPYLIAGELYGSGFVRNPDRFFFKNETTRIRELLSAIDFQGEYWVTDFGISISNRNYIQDSCYRGAEILDSILTSLDQVDSVAVFYASDLLSTFSDSASVLSGSGGVLSRSGIRKPAYYAFRFLRQLGDHKIVLTQNCIATCTRPDDISILCWNKRSLGPKYYMTDENAVKLSELDQYFESSDPYWMELQISDLEPGLRYRIRQRILNTNNGSPLHSWMNLGATDSLSRDDLEYLSQTCVPAVQMQEKEAESGMLRISFRMEANEMRMIHITRA